MNNFNNLFKTILLIESFIYFNKFQTDFEILMQPYNFYFIETLNFASVQRDQTLGVFIKLL